MGKSQIGELEVSELVTTLLISEVASLPIADPDIPLMNAIIPILLVVSVEIIVSTLKNKSERLKKYIEGEPIFVIKRGVLIQRALKDNRISINELLCEMRTQGIGDIQDVHYAILEQNGKLSILKSGESERLAHAIIIDNEVIEKNLLSLGYSTGWLENELKRNGVELSEVFWMTVDDGGSTTIILQEAK